MEPKLQERFDIRYDQLSVVMRELIAVHDVPLEIEMR